MAILKGFYNQPKKLGSSQTRIPTILDVNILDMLFSFFKITMMSNAQWAMDQPMYVNLVSRFWKKLSSNALLCVQFFEFMKVVELAVVQIKGYVEDEKTFSTLCS
jgi:TRAP-type mannitol/chloroaromatic compound transport system permease large subunit